jgi:hypothetical protein
VGFLTAFKYGSYTNYFNDFLTVTTISLAYWLTVRRPQKALVQVAAVWLMIFLPCWGLLRFYEMVWNKGEIPLTRLQPVPNKSYQGFVPPAEYVRAQLAATPGAKVLALPEPAANLLHEHVVVPDRFLAERTYITKAFRYREFQQMVSDGRVRFVVTEGGKLPEPYLGATFTQYRKVAEFPTADVWEWQGATR